MRNEPSSSDPSQIPCSLRSVFKDLCDHLAVLLAPKFIDLLTNASQAEEPDEEQPS